MPWISSPLLKRFSPAIWGFLLCCGITGAFAAWIKSQTHGMFVYPLDDSYIHLALARTLAFDHVWGIDSSRFASASSSPGWTLILAAADLVFGSHLTTPIIINLILAGCVVAVVDAMVRKMAPQASLKARLLISTAIVVATPLPNIVFTGMEHVAQTLTVLLVIWYGARVLSVDPKERLPRREVLCLCLAGLAAGAIRYEAVFAVVPVGALLLWRRRFGVTAMLAVCSACGPLGFGIYSHHMSGYLLPYSVLAKAGMPVHQLIHGVQYFFGFRGFLPIVLLVLLVWLLRRSKHQFWEPLQLTLLLTCAVGTLHVMLAPVGWMMRYESYIVCIGLACLLLAVVQPGVHLPSRFEFRHLARQQQWVVAALAIALVPFSIKLIYRAGLGTVNPVRAAVDRYNEHIQMVRFVGSMYPHDHIVVNDIGAISFYTPARLLDVSGLGSEEPLKALRKKVAFSPSEMTRWANEQKATIAIIQIDYKSNREAIPADWPLVQVWHVPRNVVFFDHSIGFFAVHPENVERLCTALENFPLPSQDKVTYDACPVLTQPNGAGRSGNSAEIVNKLAQPLS